MAYLGRLRVALRAAGVPKRLVDPFISASERFWQDVFDTGDRETGLAVSTSSAEEVSWREGLLLDWLDSRWRVIRRWKAWHEAAGNGARTEPD